LVLLWHVEPEYDGCIKLPQTDLSQNQKRLKDYKGCFMSMSLVFTNFGNQTEHLKMATVLAYISQSQWKNTECTWRQASYKSSTKNYCQAEEKRKGEKERKIYEPEAENEKMVPAGN
jgi:hypothetical protein